MSFKCFRSLFFRILLFLVLAMLIFECYIYLFLSRDKRYEIDKKFIQDYEAVLCGFNIPLKRARKSTGSCPTQGIVTSFKFGGLSKIMWQYANILSASIVTGLDGYIPICIKNILARVFDNLTLADLADIGHCSVPLPESASTVEDWTEVSQSIVIRSTDLCNDEVVKYLEVIRHHFVFNSVLVDIALSCLLKAKGDRTNVTFVGVHIANTEIIANQEYDDIYPSVQFFVEAMNEFRKEDPRVVFVAITDNEKFWRTIFKPEDSYMVGDEITNVYGGPLAVLSHCNHTILGTDGYAVWGAILAGGKTIVSLSLGEDYNYVIQHYDNWVHLVNNTKSEIKGFGKLFNK